MIDTELALLLTEGWQVKLWGTSGGTLLVEATKKGRENAYGSGATLWAAMQELMLETGRRVEAA